MLGDGNGVFTRVQEGIAVNQGGWSVHVTAADIDSDGLIDIFISNSNAARDLLLGSIGGGFTEVAIGDIVSDLMGKTRATLAADINFDSRVDLVVTVYIWKVEAGCARLPRPPPLGGCGYPHGLSD